MSRKEEIEEAAWCNYPLIKGGEEQFIQGAEWADKTFLNKLWHDASEEPEIDRLFILVAPNKNTSLAICGGKSLLTCTLAGGHNVISEGDKWCYLDDILPDNK